MMQLTISQIGRQVGLRPSAIRYYERIGILHPPPRVAGQRRYDEPALYRLTVIQRARTLGFTLDEIRTLLFAFDDGVPAAPRWRQLTQRKLDQLAQLMDGINARQSLLRQQGACTCSSLEECGRCMVENQANARST